MFGKVIEAVSNPAVIVAELEDVIVGGAGDTSQEMNQLKREIRDLEGQQIRLIQQRSKDVIDQELLERQIGPVKALCDEKRQSLRVLEEQQRVRDSKWEREPRPLVMSAVGRKVRVPRFRRETRSAWSLRRRGEGFTG